MGGADPAALVKAARVDGATPVVASEQARAHVRNAPPSVRKAPLHVFANGGAVVGAPTSVLGGPAALPGAYVLVNVDGVITSHTVPGFALDPAYPIANERRYHVDKHEQLKVIRNAQNLVAAYLITDNPDSVNGPPVCVQYEGALVVLGGNSRAMSLVLAYRDGNAAGYRALLVERAKVFGLAPKDLDTFTSPILVRVVDAKQDEWQGLSRTLNEAQTQELDTWSEAVSVAGRLREAPRALAADVDGDETLTAFLSSPRARPTVRALLADDVITRQSAGKYTAGADLTEEGRDFVERVLVARIVGDVDLVGDLGPARRDLVARAAPAFLAAAHDGHDLQPALRVALADVADVKRTGAARLDDEGNAVHVTSTGAEVTQGGLFASATTARARSSEAVQLRALLLESGPRFVRVLRKFAELAHQRPAHQVDLAGPVTTVELLNSAIKATEPQAAAPTSSAAQAGLF
ncbi:MAG: hypothetical protein WCO19_01945 [Candidatus Saccharibacteria bacterium]